MAKDDFDISVDNGILTISSERSSEQEEKTNDYITREFSHRVFSRSFTLPEDVDDEHINAEYTDGILYIHLPKAEMPEVKERVKWITIK